MHAQNVGIRCGVGGSPGVGTLESGRGRGKETDVMTIAGGSPEDAYSTRVRPTAE